MKKQIEEAKRKMLKLEEEGWVITASYLPSPDEKNPRAAFKALKDDISIYVEVSTRDYGICDMDSRDCPECGTVIEDADFDFEAPDYCVDCGTQLLDYHVDREF